MEDQSHLTLGEKKKNEPSTMPRGKKEEEKRERERERERKRGERRRRRKKKAYSLPSLHERSETPGALDRHDWESQEANPLPRTILSASVCITGYQHSGCRWGCRESNVYGAAQTPSQLLGRQMFRTPVCKRTRHLDFPPKLGSNSIFKPPAS